jgi:two-component system cell cycle sensor histidine kinase/response regulator CckA
MVNEKILVVEDEAIVARDIENRLKNLGYDVPMVVSSGEDAVQKADETQPDLVLMDIKLKGKMDGIEAAEHIHDRLGIPVIYLTAYADENTLQRAKITEPYGYILKPFNDLDLHSNIEMALYRNKMGKKLSESNTWFSTALNSIGDAVIVTDTDGNVTFINPAAETLTGWNMKEAEGKLLTDLFNVLSKDKRNEIKNLIKSATQGGVVIGLKSTILVAKNGVKIPIHNSAAPLKDNQGKINGVVLVIQDNTERKKTEDELLEKINRLEMYKKATTDRELKMIELKKEIDQLCERLGEKSRYNEE